MIRRPTRSPLTDPLLPYTPLFRSFGDHTGVETSDPYIDDRIFELTGVKGVLESRRYGTLYPLVRGVRAVLGKDQRRNIGGRLYLEPRFPLDYFQGKRCLDIGRSEEHTSELQSLMRTSHAVFSLNKQ